MTLLELMLKERQNDLNRACVSVVIRVVDVFHTQLHERASFQGIQRPVGQDSSTLNRLHHRGG